MKESEERMLSAAEQPASGNKSVNNHFDSHALFCGQQEILVEHAGHAYRLRITSQYKLILMAKAQRF